MVILQRFGERSVASEARDALKREPGENPGQSRCCKFQSNRWPKEWSLESAIGYSGKAAPSGNKPEYLPGRYCLFEGLRGRVEDELMTRHFPDMI